MSKLMITATSAALILMSSVAFASPNQDMLDELTIQMLGNEAMSGAFADSAVFSEYAARGNSAYAAADQATANANAWMSMAASNGHANAMAVHAATPGGGSGGR